MKIIGPSVKIREKELDSEYVLNIENAARICYKSNSKDDNTSSDFLKQIIKNGHESVLEHEKVTVLFTVDRGVSHEIVRHRIASYSQESTRYCNYAHDKFGNEITVIEPFFYVGTDFYEIWRQACEFSEKQYMRLVKGGAAQEARTILPNSLKTEIVVTYNMREWRHFFNLRCSDRAHPQMQQVTIPLLLLFKSIFRPVFDDILYNEKYPTDKYAEIIIIKEQ